MPLLLAELQTQLTKEAIRDTLEDLLEDADFPVDAWQDEGVARAFLETQAALGASLSERVAYLSRQGFLSSAEADFLTALVLSDYDELRNVATTATFSVTLQNGGNTTHVIASRTIVIRAPEDGQTFINSAGATLTAHTNTVVPFEAQAAGAAGNIEAQVLEMATPLAGVVPVFDGTIVSAGADEEEDPQLRERARTKWGTLRVEKVREGTLNLARNAAPAIHSVYVDDSNPRGPGTVDVYLAAENATAGGADVILVQAALDDAFFGNGALDVLVLAIAAPTVVLNLTAIVYVRNTTAEAATALLETAWTAFLGETPIGGFDLSPGPQNTIPRAMIIAALADADPSILAVDVTSPLTDVVVAPNTKVLEGTAVFTIVVLPTT